MRLDQGGFQRCPHRSSFRFRISLGREEAMRRLKDGTDARGIQRAGAEGRRGAMGRQSHDLSRPRARAGGGGSCRCRGRSCPGGGRAAVAVAAICRSGAGRDPESRQSAADETRLNCNRCALQQQRIAARQFRKLDGNEFLDHRHAREKGTDLRSRHDIRQAVRPSIPGGLCDSARAALSRRFGAVISPSAPRPADAGTAARAAAQSVDAFHRIAARCRSRHQRPRTRPGPAALRRTARTIWRPRRSRHRGHAAAQRR